MVAVEVVLEELFKVYSNMVDPGHDDAFLRFVICYTY